MPGLAAKDVIDIQVTVADLERADGLTRPLIALGFRQGTTFEYGEFHAKPATDLELRKLYMREPEGERRAHLHIRELGRFNQRYALLFRDYLRAAKVVCKEYECLKQRAAQLFPDSIEGYLKDPVFHIIYEAACLWASTVGGIWTTIIYKKQCADARVRRLAWSPDELQQPVPGRDVKEIEPLHMRKSNSSNQREKTMKSRLRITITALCLCSSAVSVARFARLAASTSDWPQWRGPQRNGISQEVGLLKQWPAEGPKLLWQLNDIGDGYSTPAVVGTRIYLLSNCGYENEFVQALSTKDGKLIWTTRIGNVGNARDFLDAKARSTPTVDGDFIYAPSADGASVR